MEPSEVLKQAWAAVESAGVPEPIQLKAFELAVGMLSQGDSGTAHERSQRDRQNGSQKQREQKPRTDDDSPIGKVAHESGISADELEEVLYFDAEGQPHVTGPARRLGKNTAEQARTVTLLITAARYLAMDEPTVESKVVRTECARLKCFNQSNFGSHTRSAPGVTSIGDGQSRTFKLKAGDSGLVPLKEAVDRVRGVPTDS